MVFLLFTSLAGIILGALLAALGLVFDQQTIQTGGMVTILTLMHLQIWELNRKDCENALDFHTHSCTYKVSSELQISIAGGRGVFLVAGGHPGHPPSPQHPWHLVLAGQPLFLLLRLKIKVRNQLKIQVARGPFLFWPPSSLSSTSFGWSASLLPLWSSHTHPSQNYLVGRPRMPIALFAVNINGFFASHYHCLLLTTKVWNTVQLCRYAWW